MPTMAELLSDADARRLNEIQFPTTPVAQPGTTSTKAKRPRNGKGQFVKRPKHERLCGCERRHDGFTVDGDRRLHKACGRPLPVRGASVVPVTVPCAGGCGINVTVPVRKVVPEAPRVATCLECATAIAKGQPITILTRPKGFAPMGITTNKELPVPVNLDTIPSAQLGETIKQAERERLAAALPAKVKKAKKKRAKADKAERKAKRAERRDLTTMGVLDGFTLRGVEVPALDVAHLSNIDTTPNGKARSPYNRVRHREGLPLLPRADEPGSPSCTWAMLIDEHQRMTALAQGQAKAEPKTKPKAKKPGKKAQIAAPIDLTERQIAAIVTAVGCSEKKARKILAGMR